MSERPFPAAALARAVAALDGGLPYKQALEELLLALDAPAADWLMQQLREARGAWAPLARAGPGRALFVGDPLSGTPVALGRLGFDTTVLGRDATSLAFAAHRARALVGGPAAFVLHPGGARLPFEERAFDLLVHDGGLPGPRTGWGHDLAECLRVTGGELVLVADNRFGYKRSAGAHGAFHVLGPLEYARAVLAPERGRCGLRGYRRALERAGLAGTEAYALYPHSGQFVHVVSLDRARPRLPVGPKERRNRLKVVGARLGLFPVLTPSFALLGGRAAAAGPRRIERILAALAERLGEPEPEVEQLIATRGNTAVFLTRAAGRERPREQEEREPRGRWCLHLPLGPSQQVLTARHFRSLGRLRAERPGVPVPEPLFEGVLEGAYLTCERRLGGRTAPELSDAPAVARRLLADAARLTADLALGPARPLGADDFEQLLGVKFELVLRHAAVASTLARTRALRDRAREELVGRSLPRVLYHADLRGKHVQIDPAGRVLGILDWSTLEDPGLPYVDLLHLVIHERKQTADLDAGTAWRAIRERGARHPHEAEALGAYAAGLGLEDGYLRLIEDLYPVLVGAMAERNWDYSRPRWVHEQFGF